MKNWKIIGQHLGYPQCCINYFINVGGILVNPKGREAGQCTGFIPCPTCANKVLKGEVKLDDLINNREHTSNFPHHNTVRL